MPSTFNFNGGFNDNKGKNIFGNEGTINIKETHNAAPAQSTSGGNGRDEPEDMAAAYISSDEEEELTADWVKEQLSSNPLPDVITVTGETFDEEKRKKYLAIFKDKVLNTKKGNPYPMKREVRGKCLIFNNACEQDMKATEHVFKQLGFKCITHPDKTADEMKEILDNEAEKDYTKHDCLVIVITAHGDEGVVSGVDRSRSKVDPKYLDIHAMVKQFYEIPSLAGKPKLFFIAACRGGQEDKGMPSALNKGMPSALNDAASSFSEIKVAKGSDVFVGMSTPRDYVTWVKDGNATYYIQAIVHVFARWAYKLELMDLMKRVRNLVMNEPHKKRTSGEEFAQVPEFTSTLGDFYFFPGLYEGKEGL